MMVLLGAREGRSKGRIAANVGFVATFAVVVWLWASAGLADDVAGRNRPTDQASGPYAYTNRLIDSDDPYLLLHAHNPVDWYPWGPEADLPLHRLQHLLLVPRRGADQCSEASCHSSG